MPGKCSGTGCAVCCAGSDRCSISPLADRTPCSLQTPRQHRRGGVAADCVSLRRCLHASKEELTQGSQPTPAHRRLGMAVLSVASNLGVEFSARTCVLLLTPPWL